MKAMVAIFLILASWPAAAALEVFACTPEWGSLAQELGGDKVRVYTATTALQDPHRIQARPSLIARARRANLVVCTGADLEAAWLPLVQRQSGNNRIQAGQRGYFEAAAVVELIDRPVTLDRSLGDLHAAGNPHLHLDPRNIAKVAAALSARMRELDAANAVYYSERAAAFGARWREATARWERDGKRLRGLSVVVHHRDLAYLVAWLGMREIGALEPKPGLPPTTAHLSDLLATLRRTPAQVIVRSAYSDPRPAEWLAEQSGIPAVVVPYTVGGTAEATDLFTLFDATLERLLKAVR